MITRILQNTAPTITQTLYSDGSATDLGVVTLAVTYPDGTTADAAPTVVDNSDGTYEYDMPVAVTANPTVVTLTWTVDDGQQFVTYVEVVGNFLLSDAAGRAFDNSALLDTSKYSVDELADATAEVTDLLETWTGRSWVPRFARSRFAGYGRRMLHLADGVDWDYGGDGRAFDVRSVLSADDGAAVTVANIAINPTTGELYRTDGAWTARTVADPYNVTVEWVYGLARPVDGVERIVALLVRDRLAPSDSDFGGRATSYSTDLWRINLETPGRAGNVSTIPEVNEWVKSHMHRLPV